MGDPNCECGLNECKCGSKPQDQAVTRSDTEYRPRDVMLKELKPLVSFKTAEGQPKSFTKEEVDAARGAFFKSKFGVTSPQEEESNCAGGPARLHSKQAAEEIMKNKLAIAGQGVSEQGTFELLKGMAEGGEGSAITPEHALEAMARRLSAPSTRGLFILTIHDPLKKMGGNELERYHRDLRRFMANFDKEDSDKRTPGGQVTALSVILPEGVTIEGPVEYRLPRVPFTVNVKHTRK